MEDYTSIFFAATSLWAVVILYLIYLHRRVDALERALKEE